MFYRTKLERQQVSIHNSDTVRLGVLFLSYLRNLKPLIIYIPAAIIKFKESTKKEDTQETIAQFPYRRVNGC